MKMLEDIYDEIEEYIKEAINSSQCDYIENWELMIYGSTVNGLAVKGEFDLDLTIIIETKQGHSQFIDIHQIKEVLNEIALYLDEV